MVKKEIRNADLIKKRIDDGTIEFITCPDDGYSRVCRIGTVWFYVFWERVTETIYSIEELASKIFWILDNTEVSGVSEYEADYCWHIMQ